MRLLSQPIDAKIAAHSRPVTATVNDRQSAPLQPKQTPKRNDPKATAAVSNKPKCPSPPSILKDKKATVHFTKGRLLGEVSLMLSLSLFFFFSLSYIHFPFLFLWSIFVSYHSILYFVISHFLLFSIFFTPLSFFFVSYNFAFCNIAFLALFNPSFFLFRITQFCIL